MALYILDLGTGWKLLVISTCCSIKTERKNKLKNTWMNEWKVEKEV